VARSIDEILTPETGKILRQAREARGLSIADAAARLRLNPQYIESMEAGDLRPLPPGPYRKAFLSEYAKFLGIKFESLQGTSSVEDRDGIISAAVSAVPDVAKKVTKSAVKTTGSVVKKVEEGVKEAVEEITARELWQEAEEVRKERLGITEQKADDRVISVRKKDIPPPPKEEVEDESIEEEARPVSRSFRRKERLLLDRDIAKESYPTYEPEEREEDMSPGMSRATKTIVGLLVVITAIVGYSLLSKKQNPATTEPEQKIAVKQNEQKTSPIAQKLDSNKASASNDSLIFTINANDTVWVSVTPDIGNGFRGKMAKGEVRRFSAKEKYFLYLGNQKAVSMTLDGKPISGLPTIPGSNLVVRNVVLERGKISVASSQGNVENPEVVKKNSATTSEKFIPVKKNSSKGQKNAPIKTQIKPLKPVFPR
jgi:cytoskeletal protein RodZ